ncbi:hypothetical protein [Prosthecobacter dejongeii]|uniref:Uncharacterized protein n=1 Tax=Prosthecobacter dejongeii TaxID=48465 RepID=A0A7W7YNL1_9BACT|nr:hypothetical protein [Prosthecobacter dejongeii]MBB5039496.1 hypothetical protein [Prosthecobacter dejongeii]
MEVSPNCDNASLEEIQVATDTALTSTAYIRLSAIRCLLHGLTR